MSTLKCKMCGGDLSPEENSSYATCPYCGTSQTIPKIGDEKKLALFAKANEYRRQGNFSSALSLYEMIASECPEEAEAHWGLLLSKFGIEYVDDPDSGKKVPVCHHLIYSSIYDDPDYRKTIECADVIARESYEEEAKRIDELQSRICSLQDEEKFDVFISYKESDPSGNRTEDSVLAYEIYDRLTEKGYKVFFSRITLEGKAGSEYEPIIFSALTTAKVLIHVTTSVEYTNSIWVKNEWKRFIQNIDSSKILIPCYKGVNPSDLPREISRFQGIDLGKIGAYQDVVHGVGKFLNRETKAPQVVYHEEKGPDPLLTLYENNVSYLAKLEGLFCQCRDIDPLIVFFEDHKDYLDSGKYLKEAKYLYAKHVNNYKEYEKAIKYLEEISPYKESEQVKASLEKNRAAYRTKQLKEMGFFVYDNISSQKIGSVSDLAASFSFLRQGIMNARKKKDFLGKDIEMVNEDHGKALKYLFNRVDMVSFLFADMKDIDYLKEEIAEAEKLVGCHSEAEKARQTIAKEMEKRRAMEEADRKRAKRNKIIKWVIIGCILGAIGVGGVIGIINNAISDANHSPNVLSFSLNNKTATFEDDGYYYIFFYYQISNSSTVGVSSLSFNVDVAVDGTDVGTIRNTISSMGLEPNSSDIYSVYLKESRLDSTNLFNSVYSASSSSLDLSYTVTSIYFSDGERYRS